MQIAGLALRRLLLSIPTLFIILIGLFLLLQLAPGDTVDALVAQMGGGDPAMIQQMREFYGLDLPVHVQLGNYLWHLLSFDFGYSAIYAKPVLEVILERLPATLLLMISALSFAFAVGMVLGVIAARRVNKWPDTLISTLGLIFYATPSFWFGLMSIVAFAVKLAWFPSGGFGTIGANLTGFAYVADVAKYLVLPTLTLGLGFLAIYLRIMRASMLEVLTLDFVRTARAKGMGEYRVVRRHVLRNALLPMVTLIGLQANKRHHGQQGIAQYVAAHHAVLAHAFGARGAYEIQRQHFQHRRPHDAQVNGQKAQAQCQRGQDQVFGHVGHIGKARQVGTNSAKAPRREPRQFHGKGHNAHQPKPERRRGVKNKAQRGN